MIEIIIKNCMYCVFIIKKIIKLLFKNFKESFLFTFVISWLIFLNRTLFLRYFWKSINELFIPYFWVVLYLFKYTNDIYLLGTVTFARGDTFAWRLFCTGVTLARGDTFARRHFCTNVIFTHRVVFARE